jgi:hypothetical protein
MKYYPLQIILLFFSLSLSAQKPSISVDLHHGPELLLSRDTMVARIFGHDENGYFAASYDYRNAIELLDTNFKKINRKHLELTKNVRNRHYLGLCHFHDTIYLFTTEVRLKSVMLFVETIDKVTLEQRGDDQLILEVQNLAGWRSDFGFKLSREHDKLLIYSRLDAMNKKMQDVQLLLFGRDLKLEWKAEQRIIYQKNQPRRSSIEVSDDGDVFFVSLLDDQSIRSLMGGIKNRYHLIAATENGTIVNSYPLSLPELYIRGIQIEPGENHNIIIAGFYSPTHYRGLIDGAFYFELDNRTGEFVDMKIFEYKPHLLQQAVSGLSKKAPDEMFEFRVRQLRRRNNGDFILIAENQFNQNYDAYQNIIATSFAPGGIYKWTRVIKKRQNIEPQFYFNHSSYYLHAPENSDIIYFVFNERDKNEFRSPDDRLKPFNPNDPANLKVVSIDPLGDMNSAYIYRKESNKMKTPIPLIGYDKLNNEMVIPVSRMKKYEYINFTFNE